MAVLLVVEVGKVIGLVAVLRMQPDRTNASAIASTATDAQLVFVMVSLMAHRTKGTPL